MAKHEYNDGKIHLYERIQGNYLYAAAAFKTDKVRKNGYPIYKTINFGSLKGENKLFVPLRTFLDYESQWDLFVFDDSWDLSEVYKLFKKKEEEKTFKNRPIYRGEDKNRLYGGSWLLMEITKKMGLYDDLLSVFYGNTMRVNKILTLAFYPLLEKRCYNHLNLSQSYEKFPTDTILFPSDITEINQAIREENRIELFARRKERLIENDILAVDTTSKSSYSRNLADVKYGKNKEGLKLPQTNELVIYGIKSGIPVYYREWQGNTPDSRTVEVMINELEHIGFNTNAFITDRGFPSVVVLDLLIDKNYPFVCCVKAGSDYLKDVLSEYVNDYVHAMRYNEEENILMGQKKFTYYYSTKDGTPLKKELTANVYFSLKWRGEDEMNLIKERQDEEELLKEVIDGEYRFKISKEQIKSDCRLFTIKFDEGTDEIISYEFNEKKYNTLLRTAGFVTIISNDVDGDAEEIFRLYHLRDDQEKYFEMMKSIILDDRNRVSTESSKNGRLLINFVALSILCYIREHWRRSKEARKLFATSEMMVETMKGIRLIEHKGRAPYMTPFIGRQLDACRLLEIDVPLECQEKKKSISSKTGKRKRVRLEN